MTSNNYEIWRPINGHNGDYEISSTGIVRSTERMIMTKNGIRMLKGKVLRSKINKEGYQQITLTKAGKSSTMYIHKLVANAFIPNPLNKLEINHINGIKSNNNIENLEWMTHSENIKHAYLHGLLKPKYKKVIDMCTGKKYNNAYEAALDLKINYGTFRNYLNGNIKNKTCLKYVN